MVILASLRRRRHHGRWLLVATSGQRLLTILRVRPTIIVVIIRRHSIADALRRRCRPAFAPIHRLVRQRVRDLILISIHVIQRDLASLSPTITTNVVAHSTDLVDQPRGPFEQRSDVRISALVRPPQLLDDEVRIAVYLQENQRPAIVIIVFRGSNVSLDARLRTLQPRDQSLILGVIVRGPLAAVFSDRIDRRCFRQRGG
mmetsp:Transcript_37623/g.90723  ORF Transcript_37623/g.90723 Transcript_37623/m.90723 type:complete len:201 (-) Transcript_37623:550-1152(-)